MSIATEEPKQKTKLNQLEQLKKLPDNHARRQRNFGLYTEFFRRHHPRSDSCRSR